MKDVPDEKRTAYFITILSVIYVNESMISGKFDENNIKNWEVNYQEGKNYYYKDYPEKKVRLIGLDCMLKDNPEEQEKWLALTLKDAKEKDLNVTVLLRSI